MENITLSLASLLSTVCQCTSHLNLVNDKPKGYNNKEDDSNTLSTASVDIYRDNSIHISHLEISNNVITIDMRSSVNSHYNDRDYNDTGSGNWYSDRCYIDEYDNAVLQARMNFFKANSP